MAVQAEIKEIIQDYVLITYDIPATEKTLRNRFLRDAGIIGAIMHTQSCYLLPYSEKAFELANELAAKGVAIVWKSRQEDKDKALEITTKYGQHVAARCQMIEQRLAIAQEYITEGKLAMALRLGIKTGRLLKQLSQITQTYHPEWLTDWLATLVAKWQEVHGG